MSANPWLNSRAYDTITLDGKTSPGLCIRTSGGRASASNPLAI